jgi:hypothetical protein
MCHGNMVPLPQTGSAKCFVCKRAVSEFKTVTFMLRGEKMVVTLCYSCTLKR